VINIIKGSNKEKVHDKSSVTRFSNKKHYGLQREMGRGPELDLKYFCRFADDPDFGGQSNFMP
jgi:hypothetical protein